MDANGRQFFQVVFGKSFILLASPTMGRLGHRSKTGEPFSTLSPLFCWRPRRDLNPCYRRERAVS
jgi:hypothetical protein